MWPFQRPPAPPAETLVARLEVLEDRYRRLERRFDKLQGEFTSLYRYEDEEGDEDAR